MELSQSPISHPHLPPMPLPIAPSSPIALLARDPLVGMWAASRGRVPSPAGDGMARHEPQLARLLPSLTRPALPFGF